MERLIDSHAHLCHKAFEGEVDAVLERARRKGVAGVVNVAVDLDSSRTSVELAEAHEGVWTTVGVHPHDASRMNEKVLRELRSLCASKKVVAIGESGLDFYRMLSPRWAQEEAFRLSLRLAAQQGLPLVAHCRNAELEVLEILREFRAGFQGRVVIHCFSGLPEYARRFVEEGALIGLAGNVTYWTAERRKRTLRPIPLDRMLLETDAPYLGPGQHRGKRNEPAYLTLVLAQVASALEQPVAEVAAATTKNAERLFGIQTKGDV